MSRITPTPTVVLVGLRGRLGALGFDSWNVTIQVGSHCTTPSCLSLSPGSGTTLLGRPDSAVMPC